MNVVDITNTGGRRPRATSYVTERWVAGYGPSLGRPLSSACSESHSRQHVARRARGRDVDNDKQPFDVDNAQTSSSSRTDQVAVSSVKLKFHGSSLLVASS